jgi:hypothetical protein
VRRHPLPDLLLGELARREVADVLVHPVGRQPGDDALLPPRRRAISRRHDHEVFQSSRMSWSSNIIARAPSRRPADDVVAPREAVELGVLDEVLDLLAGRLVEAAPSRMNSSSSGCGVVSA